MAIAVFTILLLIITKLISKEKGFTILSGIIGFIYIGLLTAFVRFTPDWEFYQYFYNVDGAGKELIYRKLIEISKFFNLSFYQFHRNYILIYCLLFIGLIYKFQKNVLPIALIFLLINYLFFTTQIRFFLAYFIACWAAYYYFIKGNKLFSYLLFILSLLCHDGVVFMIPVVFSQKIMKKNILPFLFCTFLVSVILVQILPFSKSVFGDRFTAYISDRNLISSISGGIFYFMPFVINLFIINKLYNTYKFHLPPKEINSGEFLFRMSVFYYLYIGVALTFQVIGHRFIVPSLLFQLLLFFLLLNYIPKSKKPKILLVFAAWIICMFLLYYILPKYIVKADTAEIVLKMLKSNSIINALLL